MFVMLFLINTLTLSSFFLDAANPKENLKFGLGSEIGTFNVNNQNYFKLDLMPEIDNIYEILNLNLRVTFLYGLDKEKGIIKYGPYASEKWYKALTIKWLELDAEYLKLRFGEFENLTYGYELMMEDYSSYALLGTIEYFNNHTFKFMIPSYDYFNSQKNYLYAFRYELELFYEYPLLFGLNYFRENFPHSKIPFNSFSSDLFIDISDYFIPYLEVAKMLNFGSAFLLGFRGSWNIFTYDLGYKFLGEKFLVRIYDEFYNYEKDILDLNSLKFKNGLHLKLGLNIENKFEGYIKYEDFAENDKNITLKFFTNVLEMFKINCKYKQREVAFDNLELFSKANSSYLIYVGIPFFSIVELSLGFKKRVKEPFNFGFKILINVFK